MRPSHPSKNTNAASNAHTHKCYTWSGMIVFHFIFHQDLPGTVRLRLSCLSSRFLLAFGCKYNCGGGSAACCSAAYLQKMGWWLFRWVTFQHYLHIWYSLIQNISFATDWLLTCPGYVTVYIQQAKALKMHFAENVLGSEKTCKNSVNKVNSNFLSFLQVWTAGDTQNKARLRWLISYLFTLFVILKKNCTIELERNKRSGFPIYVYVLI